jgi:hypothetical protein
MKYIITLMLILCGMVYAQPTETPQYTGFLVHSADSNDTALDPNTNSWYVCKSWVKIPEWANGLKVKFYAYDPNDPNGETFSYQLYVCDYGSNAELVASGSGTVGGSKLSYDPINLKPYHDGVTDPNYTLGAIDTDYAWVDTLGTITTDWFGGVSAQNDGGLNDCSSFIFDRQSARHIYCRIYGLSAYLKIYCIAYGY